MKNILNRLFHLEEKQASIKTEIIGGIITFIAMCYILPVNTKILSDIPGFNATGIFMVTALLSFIITMIMGLVVNYPVLLSAGMGLNAYIAYTLPASFSWQQKMILVTICGIIFFILSLTPVRRIIIEAIPKPLKLIISSALGAFILFVGLKGTGIIADEGSTLVTLGNFADPAVIVGIVSIFITIALMFVKNKTISTLAVPIGILIAAVMGLTISLIMKENGAIAYIDGSWVYTYEKAYGVTTTLPIAPWYKENPIHFADFSGLKDVLFFGSLNGYTGEQFGNDLLAVLSNPACYVGIFAMILVNIFDTTATLIAVGGKHGFFDEQGRLLNYRKVILADATGALICGPLGTSTVTSFAESNVGVAMGAKTGLMAVSGAFMFLLSAFIYPVFSIFTAGSVTASALVCVGLTIMANSFSDIDFKDRTIAFSAAITVLFAVLCYSISYGIGFGLITYSVIKTVQGKYKEVGLPIFIIAALFLTSFVLSAVI